jgi:hypothetical protein
MQRRDRDAIRLREQRESVASNIFRRIQAAKTANFSDGTKPCRRRWCEKLLTRIAKDSNILPDRNSTGNKHFPWGKDWRKSYARGQHMFSHARPRYVYSTIYI